MAINIKVNVRASPFVKKYQKVPVALTVTLDFPDTAWRPFHAGYHHVHANFHYNNRNPARRVVPEHGRKPEFVG
jgi:hypothetical protein